MPRQMIYPVPSPDGADADRRIEVGWDRHQSVQVATTRLRPGVDRDAEYVEGSHTGEPPRAWDGMFVDLDRDQINELIRALRRARDQAFGRDE